MSSTLLLGLGGLAGVTGRLWSKSDGKNDPPDSFDASIGYPGVWDVRATSPDEPALGFQFVPKGRTRVWLRAPGYVDQAFDTTMPDDGAKELRMEPAPPAPEAGFLHTYAHEQAYFLGGHNLVYGFADDRGPWQFRGYSAHMLPVCVLKGEDIRPFIQRARSYGANALVTLGCHLSPWKDANGWHFDPRTQEAKDALARMFDIGAEEGMRFAHGVAADFQHGGLSDSDKVRIWNEQCDLMDGRWNLLARKGNEAAVNGWTPDAFPFRDLHGVLQSAGSAGEGHEPHPHTRDFSEWESRRSPLHKSLDDSGAGILEQHNGYWAGDHNVGPYHCPIVMIEGIFFADTDPDHVGDRRCTDAEIGRLQGLQIGATCAGGAVGTSLGLEGKLDGEIAATCTRAQFEGMRAAFLR